VSFSAALEAAARADGRGVCRPAGGRRCVPVHRRPGFTGFNTPATFAQFNRALAAKILVHRATFVNCTTCCWAMRATAMNASFVTTAGLPGSLATGVYYAYSASAGEPANPVSEPLANDRLWVHPSIMTGAQQLRAARRTHGSPPRCWTRAGSGT
jgi:starch-binding outer membrane protein, SusD/RagB family